MLWKALTEKKQSTLCKYGKTKSSIGRLLVAQESCIKYIFCVNKYPVPYSHRYI